MIVDFHAETTAEKIVMGYQLDGQAALVVGTHTHVQTADERIINSQMAFITDVGFCGDINGVIGMDYEASLNRLMTNLPERFDIADTKESVLNGILAVVGGDGKAKSIKRFCITKNYEEGIK